MSAQQDTTLYYLEKHIQSLKNAALNAGRMASSPCDYDYYFEAEIEPQPLIRYGVCTVHTCSSHPARPAQSNVWIPGEDDSNEPTRLVAFLEKMCLE